MTAQENLSGQTVNRRSRRSMLVVGVIAVILAVGIVGWQSIPAQDRVPWRGDYETAKTEAAHSNKPLFIWVTADWCGPCQQLKTTTWADRGVAKTLESFVPLRLDFDRPENKPLLNQYSVTMVPRFLVLDHQGHLLRSYLGYQSPEEFRQWIAR
jgi:thiol:disulfide interchange protein